MKIFALTLFALLFAGCMDLSLGRFTLISTSNVKLPAEVKKSQIVEGQSCVHRVLFFTWGKQNDRLSSAVEDALEKAREKGIEGELLSDVEMQEKFRNYFFGYKDCVIAKGKVVSFKK